jgi:hypothetical protein
MTDREAHGGVDVHGPVFISYRQSDGTPTSASVARRLRAAGVPVWRDKTDLPPGDTTARLQEAIDAGISGAVIVITDHVIESQVMREVEVPRLLELHRSDPRFALQIVNKVRAGGKVDYAAPDRLLQLAPGTLKGVDQQPATTKGLQGAARALVELRVARHRDVGAHDLFAVSVQSRNEGRASDVSNATLGVRLEASLDGRLPSRVGLEDLRWVCSLLPTLFVESRQSVVSISGGSHLSPAFAIGAALPSTRAGRMLICQGSHGAVWDSASAVTGASSAFGLLEEARDGATGPAATASAVYVDVVAGEASDFAFDQFWAQHSAEIREALVLRSEQRIQISAEQGPALAAEIMARIRALWGRCGNGEVHLFLRVPFPLAVLLGRLSNTLSVTVYEWTAADGARYVPALRVESGAQPSAVREIVLPIG